MVRRIYICICICICMCVCVCARAHARVYNICIRYICIYIIFTCACLLRKSTGKKDQVRTIQFLAALPSPIPPFPFSSLSLTLSLSLSLAPSLPLVSLSPPPPPSLWRGREYWRGKGEKKQRRARENGKRGEKRQV